MKIQKIWFENESIFIQTSNGEIASHPLSWFPRLSAATSDQRANYTLSPMGIHWEEIDEDLSFEGFFSFTKENKDPRRVEIH